MYGLTTLNVELTSRCNKSCWMCGRRKLEREHPDLCDWGDMPLEVVQDIAETVPDGIVVQFHWNGEPLLYPYLGDALRSFGNTIRCLDTNGKLLMEKADDIIGNLETITISVIEKDPEADEQFATVCQFIDKKCGETPSMVYRLLGKVENRKRWEELPGIIADRILHAPEGSFNYEDYPTVPEIGVCLDLLGHLAVDRFGNVSPCVRYDPCGWGILGSIHNEPLPRIWYGNRRRVLIMDHINQDRGKNRLCGICDYWGVPKG